MLEHYASSSQSFHHCMDFRIRTMQAGFTNKFLLNRSGIIGNNACLNKSGIDENNSCSNISRFDGNSSCLNRSGCNACINI